MEKIRLQKYLSQAGICSRRKGEEYIKNGFITVNGKTAEIGELVDPENDIILYMDDVVKEQKNFVYYKLNKPRGVVTTCATTGERGILDVVDIKERVFPIGRLDKDTTGLILLTNDGRLANYLMHPKYVHEKEYIVKVYGPISDELIEKLKQGVYITGRMTKEAVVKRISSGTVSITIAEGRNRQIRRMIAKVGNEVKTLKRVRIENIEIGDLNEGEYIKLNESEKSVLFKSCD